MQITVRTFASLRDLSADRFEVDVADDASVADAWDALQARYPAVAAHRPYVRAARNGVYALTDRPIDVDALEASIVRTSHGAVVTFVGRARDVADDGRAVIELEYEVYPEMAASVLDEIAVEAESRFGATVAVVHRFGLVPIGEAAVAIVTAAVHRSEAYEANRFVIEAIKERLPIWKRERFADGSEWKRPGA
jgi:molybdopterin synthase catalytic subunit